MPATLTLDEEHLLVGAMLIDEGARAIALKKGISRHVIHDPTLAAIVEKMQSMDAAGYPVESVLLAKALQRDGEDITSTDLADLCSLLIYRGSIESATHYADMVIENAKVRQAWAAAGRLMEEIRANPNLDLHAALTDALTHLMPHLPTSHGGWYADVIPAFLQHLEDRWNGVGQPEYISTGWPSIDKLLRGGLYRGEYTVVGARPGIGKTVIGLGLAQNAARKGNRVAFFSAEMTTRAMLRRAGAEFTHIPTRMIDYPGHLQAEHQQAMRDRYVQQVRDDLSQLPVYIDDTSRPTVSYMEDTIERLGNIDMVVFDYLSLAGEKGKTELDKINQVSAGLMGLAKRHDIPVVALSQLNRAVESSKPYRPTLGNLRDSGQIEADAHVVMMLYRKRYYINQGMLDDDGAPDNMEVNIAKNREGDTGVRKLAFDGHTFSLTDPTAQEE